MKNDGYKNFKLYFTEKLNNSGLNLSVDIDELIKKTLIETYYILKQISSFCEKIAYMQHPKYSNESKKFSIQHLKDITMFFATISAEKEFVKAGDVVIGLRHPQARGNSIETIFAH